MGQYYGVEYTRELVPDFFLGVRDLQLIISEEVLAMKKLYYSNNVQKLRTENRLSQNQLAKEIGVCRRTISLIENNDQNVSLELAYRISAYFNLLIPDVFPPNKD